MLIKHIALATMAASLAFSAGAETTPPSANLNVALAGEVPVERDFLRVTPSVNLSAPLNVSFSDLSIQQLLSFDIVSSYERVGITLLNQATLIKGSVTRLFHDENPDYYLSSNLLAKLGSTPTSDDILYDKKKPFVLTNFRAARGEKLYFGIKNIGRHSHETMLPGKYGINFTLVFEPRLGVH
ncbi:hypothetical protein [Pandoraea fibrosis]|uniref:Uncharacterized protein n=1 Tax=Pandoraea fibrosis TaxID=1891094 RepID=A0A5E4VEV9_9BURK|nr:hypothetical protein [Pandoraea fibrosis]QHE91579.1 hypothetical protein PJ20_006955 [Pandoraea fibrosis]QHF14863.1 hypothetical protein PI93_021045 [Pandoraea fibrosis]VVE10828.1 hypothetical protein PFI31113_02596 [Pandoraea fibrosis]